MHYSVADLQRYADSKTMQPLAASKGGLVEGIYVEAIATGTINHQKKPIGVLIKGEDASMLSEQIHMAFIVCGKQFAHEQSARTVSAPLGASRHMAKRQVKLREKLYYTLAYGWK